MDYVQRILAFILQNRRGHEDGLIPKSAAFTHAREPTINLECPNIGPTGSKLPSRYGFFEEGMFPLLKWSLPPPNEKGKEVKEWFLAVENPDAPLASLPVSHGLYYSIPADRTGVFDWDFEEVPHPVPGDGSISEEFMLKGGFKYGVNRRKTIYIPPGGGLLGHGPHRYFYEIVPIDTSKLSKTGATREELIAQLEGKVIAWGQWVGVWERS